MHFKTVADLFATVRANAHKLPKDIDVVVGVPRSGLLAACAVSLATNRPCMDLPRFLEGGAPFAFSDRPGVSAVVGTTPKSALVVDDSIFIGRSMRQVRSELQSAGKTATLCAIYGTQERHEEADIVLEVCPHPRAFEWNVMNHWVLAQSCVDLDGVLCFDPTVDQNDDGPLYGDFLREALAINAPNYSIHSIVTSRLERYRPQTEDWLRRHNIGFKHLHMLDLPNAKERRKLGIHARFKADIYKQKKDCILFIESEIQQAQEINALTGKSVLAYRDMKFFRDGPLLRAKKSFKQAIGSVLPAWSKPLIKSALGIGR
jgi:uncharacterized HAD superfamily protein